MTFSVSTRGRSRGPLLALFALPLLLATAGAADEVELKDGSKIIGTIVDMNDDSLAIEGGSAGEISIPFSNVRSIRTDTVHTIVLEDGTTVTGRFTLTDTGNPNISGEGGSTEVDYGRIAVINPAPEAEKKKWSGAVTLSGKIVDGNSQTKSATANLDMTRRGEDDRFNVRADWNYAEDDGDVSQRNAKGRAKYDYFFTEHLFGYVNGSLEGDEFADLNLRSTIGVGAGYQFIETDTYKYFEEAGLSYVDEDFDMAEDGDFTAARFSGKFDWVIRPDKITFFHFHEVLWDLDDTDDVLVDTQTGVRLTVIANFFASFQVNYKWDNVPAAGAERKDTEYLVGLGYSFEF